MKHFAMVCAGLSLAGATMAGPALAQTAPAAAAGSAAVDPAADRAAGELLGLMHMDRMMKTGMAQSLAAMRSGAALDQMLSANPKLAAAKARNPAGWAAAMQRLGPKQADATEQMLQAMLPEVMVQARRSYTRNFSAAELNGLIAFYRTPLGQKTIDQMPQIMSDTMSWMQGQMPARMVEMSRTLGPEFERELKPLLDGAAPQPPAR